MKKIIFSCIVLGLMAVGCHSKSSTPQTPPPSTATTTPPAATSTPPAAPTVYETPFLKITLLPGWNAKQATQVSTSYNCVDKQNCTPTQTTQPDLAAVNITKGNYILYINTMASQASGVQGGRFAEIAMGAPGADAVVTDEPRPPCGTTEQSPAMTTHFRDDLYMSSSDITDTDYGCVAPKTGTVWYFSYITDSTGTYFNYYSQQMPPVGFVITMTYNTKDVNQLPQKGSAELNTALTDMTTMVNSLDMKNQ